MKYALIDTNKIVINIINADKDFNPGDDVTMIELKDTDIVDIGDSYSRKKFVKTSLGPSTIIDSVKLWQFRVVLKRANLFDNVVTSASDDIKELLEYGNDISKETAALITQLSDNEVQALFVAAKSLTL